MVYKFVLCVDAPEKKGFYEEDFEIDMAEMVDEGILSKRHQAKSLTFRIERRDE